MPFRLRPSLLAPLAILLPVLQTADAEVVPKVGSCPSGFHTEGEYCASNRDNASAAIIKQGSCPGGYHTDGKYCVSNRDNASDAVIKQGSCPSGYHTDGKYCVSNRR